MCRAVVHCAPCETHYVQIRAQNVLQYCNKRDLSVKNSCLSFSSFFNPPVLPLLTIFRIRPSSSPTPLPHPALSLYSSISSIRSSPSREASATTWTALTIPAIGELTTVSIFMAERTHSGWPFSTFRDYTDSSQSIKTSQIHRLLNSHCSGRLRSEVHSKPGK